MRYIKAQKVLPEEVIELIQKYVDGEFIYIPRKDGKQKAWGKIAVLGIALVKGTVKYMKST